MDQLSVHPYPNPSSPTDGPQVGYPNPGPLRRAEPRPRQAGRLRRVQRHGPADDANGLTFVIDEIGWQTDTTGMPQYVNAENVRVISEQTAGGLPEAARDEVLRLRPDGRRRPALPARRREVPERAGRDRQVHRRRLAERPPDRRRRRRLDSRSSPTRSWRRSSPRAAPPAPAPMISWTPGKVDQASSRRRRRKKPKRKAARRKLEAVSPARSRLT